MYIPLLLNSKIPSSYSPLSNKKCNSNLNEFLNFNPSIEYKIIKLTNIQTIYLDDSVYNLLEDILDITPIARSSINEPNLSVLDQELFANDTSKIILE